MASTSLSCCMYHFTNESRKREHFFSYCILFHCFHFQFNLLSATLHRPLLWSTQYSKFNSASTVELCVVIGHNTNNICAFILSVHSQWNVESCCWSHELDNIRQCICHSNIMSSVECQRNRSTCTQNTKTTKGLH